MNKIDIKSFSINFLNRLNYIIVYNQIPKINHIDKVICLYNKQDVEGLLHIVLHVAFWHLPGLVEHTIKTLYEKEVKDEFSNEKFTKYVYNRLINIRRIPITYSNSSVYLVFNRAICKNDLEKSTDILIGKMFYTYDSWFGERNKRIPLKLRRKHLKDEFVQTICTKYKGCITGSMALCYYGKVYRPSLNDFDLAVSYRYLNKNIIRFINEQKDKVKSIGYIKPSTAEILKDMFSSSTIWKYLSNKFPDIKIVKCVIDGLTEYDNNVYCDMILDNKGIEYDLMFKKSFKREAIPETNIFVQDMADIIYFKHLLGRPKDYKDLIDFKPYNQNIVHNDKRCEQLV